MEFIELAKRRYSARSYKKQPVEKEMILKLLEAARIAPTAANRQPLRIYVIQSPEMLEKIQSCYTRDWLKSAPLILAVCGDHQLGWKRSYDGMDATEIDAAIAVDHITLQASELGLGTCWICAFNPSKAREVLNLEPNVEPIVLLPIGWPADTPDINRHEKLRHKLEEFVVWM